jgi:hypothetical protein
MNNENSPIFIVGSPRSGSTLLSAMLSNHSRLSCGPETQFFNKLSTEQIKSVLASANWVEDSISLLNSLSLSGQAVVSLFKEDNESLRQYLTGKQPSEQVLLEALCVAFSKRNKKQRWIEKTPNHILYLPRIRKLYPTAKIVRIIRDPRDSAWSTTKLPWSTESYVENCYMWQTWYDKGQEFIDSDTNSYTVRYEDLVIDCEKTLRGLCEFLGEDFEKDMLDTSRSAQDVSSKGEPWKNQVSKPLDPSRLYIWKHNLSSRQQQFTSLIFCDVLPRHGYESAVQPKETFAFWPHSYLDIARNETLIEELSQRGIRLRNRGLNEEQTLIILHTLGHGLGKMKRIIQIFMKLFTRTLVGKKSYLVATPQHASSWCKFFPTVEER